MNNKERHDMVDCQNPEPTASHSTRRRKQKIYNKIKRGSSLLSLIFALNSDQATSREATVYQRGTPLERQCLSRSAQIIDWYLDGEPVLIYNQLLQFKKRRNNGRMTAEEVAFKETLARNIYPGDFAEPSLVGEVLSSLVDVFMSDSEKKASVNRFKNVVNNTSHYTKGKIEQAIAEKKIYEFEKPSIDLFRIYLGLPQLFGTIIESPFKPSIAKNKDARYFSFRTEDILRSMKLEQPLPPRFPKMFKGSTWEYFKQEVKNKKMIPSQFIWFNLHNHYAGNGYDADRHEEYISYYDIWDLDDGIIKEQGIGLDQFNYPPEIYGRIYRTDFEKIFKQD